MREVALEIAYRRGVAILPVWFKIQRGGVIFQLYIVQKSREQK
jgi:hypothetical protein